MEKKIIDLEIIDELEDSGVDAIALVDAPAIEKNFMYFKRENFVEPKAGESQTEYMDRCIPYNMDEGKSQEQAVAICISTYENMSKDFAYDAFAEYPWDECIADQEARGLDEESANALCGWIKANMAETSFTDYPEAAKENAKRALAYAEKNGWGDCGTPVGKIRANQLANSEPISLDTIARMASFERHRQNSTTPYGEGCGKLMWDAWGGDEGIAWAQRKLQQQQQFAKVSFDYDDTLSTDRGFELAKNYVDKGDTLYIISARNEVSQTMLDKAKELGIPESRVYATGSNKAKVEKVKELDISKHIDNNADVVKELGGLGEKFEINTSGLAPYTQQTPKKKKDLVEKSVALASVEELAVGDAVSWKTADQNPRGRIKEITYRSKIVPGTGFRIEGTQEDPGYIIEIYEKSEGKWQPTGKYVGRKADSILKNVELWRQRFEDDLSNDPINFNKVLDFARTAGFTADDFKHNGMEFNEIPDNFNLELAKGYTVYKYAGSVGSDTRDFCREMVGLDRFYTFEEIDAMGNQAVNPGFGLGGASTYSIWDWKGGPNCKHRWQKFYVTAEGTFQNKGPAPGTPGERPEDMPNSGYAFEKQNTYMFADESKKELVGPVAIPDMEIPRKDNDGNIYFVRFSKDVVKKMAEKFMREQRLADNNIQHKDDINAGSYVFESWIVENEGDKANSVYKLGVPVGTWMCKMRVVNPETWNKVKAGELNGFSLQGNFVSQEEYEAYMNDKKMYEDLVSLVKDL